MSPKIEHAPKRHITAHAQTAHKFGAHIKPRKPAHKKSTSSAERGIKNSSTSTPNSDDKLTIKMETCFRPSAIGPIFDVCTNVSSLREARTVVAQPTFPCEVEARTSDKNRYKPNLFGFLNRFNDDTEQSIFGISRHVLEKVANSHKCD